MQRCWRTRPTSNSTSLFLHFCFSCKKAIFYGKKHEVISESTLNVRQFIFFNVQERDASIRKISQVYGFIFEATILNLFNSIRVWWCCSWTLKLSGVTLSNQKPDQQVESLRKYKCCWTHFFRLSFFTPIFPSGKGRASWGKLIKPRLTMLIPCLYFSSI